MHFKARLVLRIPIQVVAWQQETTHESTPILLHCSDGFSRSGLMVAIAQMIWRANEEGRVSIYRVVRRLRICCPNAVAHYVSLTPNYSLQIQGNLSCALSTNSGREEFPYIKQSLPVSRSLFRHDGHNLILVRVMKLHTFLFNAGQFISDKA